MSKMAGLKNLGYEPGGRAVLLAQAMAFVSPGARYRRDDLRRADADKLLIACLRMQKHENHPLDLTEPWEVTEALERGDGWSLDATGITCGDIGLKWRKTYRLWEALRAELPPLSEADLCGNPDEDMPYLWEQVTASVAREWNWWPTTELFKDEPPGGDWNPIAGGYADTWYMYEGHCLQLADTYYRSVLPACRECGRGVGCYSLNYD